MTTNPPSAPPDQMDVRVNNNSRRVFLVSIIASVVASLIVGIFFQQLLNALNNFIVIIVSSLFSGYMDGAYSQASLGDTGTVMMFMIYGMLLIGPFIALLPVVAFPAGRTLIAQTGNVRRALQGDRQVRRWRRIGIVWVAFFLPWNSLVVAKHFVTIQAESTFRQQTVALEPYFTSTEQKALLRKWALMKKRSDYDVIREDIDNLAKKYEIELPKPLI